MLVEFVQSWVNDIKDDDSVTNNSESEPSNLLNCSDIDSETTVSSTYAVELLKELVEISIEAADEAGAARLPANIAEIPNNISVRNFHGCDYVHTGPVINLTGAIYLSRNDGEVVPSQKLPSIRYFGGPSTSQFQSPPIDSSGGLLIVKRSSWQAQPPDEEPEKLKTPVSIVIIKLKMATRHK